MSAVLASPDDVADIWRPLTDAERARAENLIAKASAMLRAACPFDVDARIALKDTDPTDPDALDKAIVAAVVADMVKRVMANPEGVASKSESVGPFSSSTTFTGHFDRTQSDVRGRLVVLDSDIDQLRPVVGFPKPFTIRTPAPRHRTGWR